MMGPRQPDSLVVTVGSGRYRVFTLEVCYYRVHADTEPRRAHDSSAIIRYFTWDGPNHFPQSQAGLHGLLEYTVQLSRAGEWRFAIRNFHSNPDSTESNDCWLQVGDNDWVKVYSQRVNEWQWMTLMDMGHGDTERSPVYHLEAGTHTVRLSGRSNGFSIDRIHVFDQSCANWGDAHNPYYTGTVSFANNAGGSDSQESSMTSNGFVWAVAGFAVGGVAVLTVMQVRRHVLGVLAERRDGDFQDSHNDDTMSLAWDDEMANDMDITTSVSTA